MFKRKKTGLLAVLLLTSMLAAACGGNVDEMPTMAGVPDDLNTATTRITDAGVFQVSITSELDPLAINEIHSWTVHIETPDGQIVENAKVSVDGGMPQHNHGFPTSPEVTGELGGGDYRVEGVKFSMSGWWELRLTIEAEGQTDIITFNIILQ